MAILTFTAVIIDFAGSTASPAERPVGTTYRLVEEREATRGFTLYKNDQRIRHSRQKRSSGWIICWVTLPCTPPGRR